MGDVNCAWRTSADFLWYATSLCPKWPKWIVDLLAVCYIDITITSCLYVYGCLSVDLSVTMDGRIVSSGIDDPAPARHPGRRDRLAVARGSLDSLRRQTTRKVAPHVRRLPSFERAGPSMGVVVDGAALEGRGRRLGRVLHRLCRLLPLLSAQDTLPLRSTPVQFIQTGIPSQVYVFLSIFSFRLLYFSNLSGRLIYWSFAPTSYVRPSALLFCHPFRCGLLLSNSIDLTSSFLRATRRQRHTRLAIDP